MLSFISPSQAYPVGNTASLQLEGCHPSDEQANAASMFFNTLHVHCSPTNNTVNQPSEALKSAFRLNEASSVTCSCKICSSFQENKFTAAHLASFKFYSNIHLNR